MADRHCAMAIAMGGAFGLESEMWWALAFFMASMIAALFSWLYWKALSESRALRQYALVVLMEESAYLSQRDALRRLVAKMDGVQNQTQLWLRVCQALDNEAQHAEKSAIPGVAAGLLWHMRNAARSEQ